MLRTRYAEKEDLPEVYVMYLQALKEIGEEYNENDALDYMLSCWSKAPCILLENNGIIGFAGLNTYSPAYCKSSVYLRDYMFYISAPHRGLKTWRTLARAVQAVSDQFNIQFVGEHRLTGNINQHLRLIKMAGARPVSILSVYGDKS